MKESLISVDEALKIVLENTENFGVKSVPFQKSSHHFLKENIYADRDFPPFDRVSMDGIGIDFDQFKKGIRSFKIEGIQAAGSSQLTLTNNQHCIEVMTGAITPKNCTAVIPYELVNIKDGIAQVELDQIVKNQNIHPKGNDLKKGDLILTENRIINAPEIGVIATVGKSEVVIANQPKVIIISTGDELVDVNETPENYQIRRSNVYTLASLLESINIEVQTIHIKDDKDALKTKIATYLNSFDVLIFSGAVSKGKFDFIPEVLDELQVRKLFHRVKQKPGKPFWFGKKDAKTIFAFPGNPVSTFACCLKYFMPWYFKCLGHNPNEQLAVLDSDFNFKADLTYFLQVKLRLENGMIKATPAMGKGSGDLSNLTISDAFLELPAHKNEFKKGELFSILPFRNFY